VLRQAQLFADRVKKAGDDPARQIDLAYQLHDRPPTAAIAAALGVVKDQCSSITDVLLNVNSSCISGDRVGQVGG
jgi:hypothetical protein